MNFDIIIIGAGLTGLSAVRAIAENNDFSMAIIEGDCIGSNNPSPLTFIDLLTQHDLQDCIKKTHSSFSFNNINGSSINYLLPGGLLAILDYKKACAKIFNSINKKIEFINHYVNNIEPIVNGVKLRLDNGKSISARILIDATGRSQLFANLFNKQTTSYYSHVYGAFFSNVKNIVHDKCCYLLPSKELGSGGGWFYSTGKDSASFGYARIMNSPRIDTQTLKTIFLKAKEEFKPFANYLQDAKIEYIEKGLIPITYINKFVYDNIIVVGDASGIATNWTCMGIEPALKYGTLAGKVAAKSILDNDPGRLYQFQRQWEQDNKKTFDTVAKQVNTFWNSEHQFWEWIIKNDLAFLSPLEVLNRIRNNSHLLKKYQILTRAVKYKIRSFLNKNLENPKDYEIS